MPSIIISIVRKSNFFFRKSNLNKSIYSSLPGKRELEETSQEEQFRPPFSSKQKLSVRLFQKSKNR